MIRLLKLMHFTGLILFLGSILTFVAVSFLSEKATLAELAFARKIISFGTQFITTPGLWLLVLTGNAMSLKKYGINNKFVRIKIFLAALILANTYIMILPAVAEATALAINSLQQGELNVLYKTAYMKETVFGAINVILTFSAMAVSIWRKGK